MSKFSTLFIILFFLLSSCATYNYKKQGFVLQQNYYEEIPFTYEKGFIFIPVVIQDKTYNFLLDTGAELNLIDPTIVSELNLKSLKKGTASNGEDSVKKIDRVEIGTIKIGNIKFEQTVGLIWDISKIGKYINCKKIDGFIGNNLLRKANWQIDYKKQLIKISDRIERLDFSDNSKKIKMNAGEVGNVHLDLEIDQKKIPFTFDTGFNGFAQTGDTTLINNNALITKIGIKGANFTGAKEGATYYKKIENFKINEFSFKSPSYFLIKPNNSSVLGNKFYENYTITIDWNNDYLILDENNHSKIIEPIVYDVSFFTDYEKRITIIASIAKNSSLINKIKPKSRVLKINNIDLIELKKTGKFCEFWSKEWECISASDILNVTIEYDGIQQDIEVKKIKSAW